MVQRSLVRIPAPYSGWTLMLCHIPILGMKKCSMVKKVNHLNCCAITKCHFSLSRHERK